MGVQTASLDSPDTDLDMYATTSNELNLDVTTLLAYVSALTNGSANWVYKEPLLTEQAERERASPLKPLLEKILEGKTLVCCQLAYDAFQSILDIVGGEGERKRAEELMKRVTVYPDVETIPEEFSHIRFTANVNERSLKIFSFGMARQIFTVTSNKAFVRSAKMQVCMNGKCDFVLSLMSVLYRVSMCLFLYTLQLHLPKVSRQQEDRFKNQ